LPKLPSNPQLLTAAHTNLDRFGSTSIASVRREKARCRQLAASRFSIVRTKLEKSGRERRQLVYLRRRRIDNRRYLQNPIRRKSSPLRMLADYIRIRRNVDAGNLVLRHITLHPLNARTKVFQYAARLLRDRLQLRGRERSGVRYLAFDEVFWHQPLQLGEIS